MSEYTSEHDAIVTELEAAHVALAAKDAEIARLTAAEQAQHERCVSLEVALADAQRALTLSMAQFKEEQAVQDDVDRLTAALAEAQRENEKLKLDRDSWERCALTTEVALQAERQQGQALREKVEQRKRQAELLENGHDVPFDDVLADMDALGLTADAPPQEGSKDA